MEFYRVWRILSSNKWILFWLPVVATCFGLGLAFILPEQYESTALVLVRSFEDIKFNSSAGEKPEILNFPVNLSAPIDAPSKTYIEVIKSPAVATKIVEALHLDAGQMKAYHNSIEYFRDNMKSWVNDTLRMLRNYLRYGRDISASPLASAVEDVEKSLVVAARKDTYAFGITYRASDPNVAAAVANMAAEIFLEQSSEAYRTDAARARQFIEVQLEKSRKALEQARADVLAFKDSGGTFSLSAEYDGKLKNVTDLEITLAKAEGKLAGLKRTRIEGSQVVKEQEAEIADLKKQISFLLGQLASYPQKEAQLDPLALRERLAVKSYEFFLKNYEEASVKESESASEIRIVSRAVPSLYPVEPLKYMYAGMSFTIAMLVAIGWVLFVESLDPRVRLIHDLDDDLRISLPGVSPPPVLGVIPTLKRSWWTVRT